MLGVHQRMLEAFERLGCLPRDRMHACKRVVGAGEASFVSGVGQGSDSVFCRSSHGVRPHPPGIGAEHELCQINLRSPVKALIGARPRHDL